MMSSSLPATPEADALLTVLGGEVGRNIGITLACINGAWQVRRLDYDDGTVWEGVGRSFADAWASLRQIHPAPAPSPIPVKAAARGFRVITNDRKDD